MAAKRRAEVVWEGSLLEGEGTIVSAGSGVLGNLAVSWPARAEERSQGKTSPEELIAAAHAACFSMALSHALSEQGTVPERLEVGAETTFVPGTGITGVELRVRGRVSGIDADGFRTVAEKAKENCPVSQALKGNVEIRLDARLEQA